jgi:hypothetical protein
LVLITLSSLSSTQQQQHSAQAIATSRDQQAARERLPATTLEAPGTKEQKENRKQAGSNQKANKEHIKTGSEQKSNRK